MIICILLLAALICLGRSYKLGQDEEYGNRPVSSKGELCRWVFAVSAASIPGLVAALVISSISFIDLPFVVVSFVIPTAGAWGYIYENWFIKKGAASAGYNLYQEQFLKDLDSEGRPNLRVFRPGSKPFFPSEKLVLSIPISELDEFKGSVQLEPTDSIITLAYFGRVEVCFEKLQDLFYLNNGDIIAGRKKVVGLFESSIKRWLNNATSTMTKDQVRADLEGLSQRALAAVRGTIHAGFRIAKFVIEDIELSAGAKNAQETMLKSNAIHEATMAILKVMPGMVDSSNVLTPDGLKIYPGTRESVEIAVGLRGAETKDVNIAGLEGLDKATLSRIAAETAAEEIPTKKGGSK